MQKEDLEKVLNLFPKKLQRKISALFSKMDEAEKKAEKTMKKLSLLHRQRSILSQEIEIIAGGIEINKKECPHPFVFAFHDFQICQICGNLMNP